MSGRFAYCPLCATPLERWREGDRVRMKCPACGFIHYDGDVRSTVIREALEETGLTVEIDALHAVESRFDDPRGNALLVLYRAHVTGGVPRAGDDAEEVRFFPLGELPPIAFEAHRKVLGELAGDLIR